MQCVQNKPASVYIAYQGRGSVCDIWFVFCETDFLNGKSDLHVRKVEMKRKMRKFFCPFGFWTVEDVLYVMGWIVLLLGMCTGIFFLAAPRLAEKILLPCPVRLFTGMYCPGCGGTRALRYLLRGDVKNSLIHHPAVLYLVCAGGIFMLSQTASRLCRRHLWAMRYRNIYLYILIALYALNFLWKNILLLLFHVRIIV